jgi:serine phosphatase RsbU (regulator of sigma subunit)
MSLRNDVKKREFGQVACGSPPSWPVWARLVRDFFDGRYGAGQSVELSEIAVKYELDKKAVLQAFAELQSLGMLSLSGNCSAVVHSPDPKEMQEAYEIRAALEEIAGRTAATVLKGIATNLRNELDAMRDAANERNFDAYAAHEVKFHRSILQASQNKALLRVWDTLALELRVHAVVGKISKHLQEVAESHQPIIDALEKGRGREAGLLLRNYVETFLEYLKKSESDSGFHRALRKDLEGAKDVQQAFFPPQSLSIPCVSCETFYQPARGIGGDYYDFLPLQGGRWGIAIGDVSGKGIGAALIMASLQASLRAQALRPHLDLPTLIAEVNRLVFESSPADFFASLFYAEYEPATRILKYVNAGHNPPIVVRPQSGSFEMFHLKSTDMPIGISADRQFAPATFQLSVDDVLVAYTDGITEAENYHGQPWGEEKLESLLRCCSGATSQQIIECILDEVSVFANGQPQRDDMTLVVMTVQKGCGR